MGKLTQEQKKMVREAEQLYLNGRFREAYDIFKRTIQESKLLKSAEDPEGVLSSTIRVINKIELSKHSRAKPTKQQKTDDLELFRDEVLTKVIQTPGMFPQNIIDRFMLLEYKPEEFSKLYYTSISANNSQKAHNILATINYDAYFRDPSPQKSYDIFLATNSPFYPKFFSFSVLINLNQENLDKVLRDLSNYGLSSQALHTCNGWGDSLAHRSIWWDGGSNMNLVDPMG
jgi:hypothetical protein